MCFKEKAHLKLQQISEVVNQALYDTLGAPHNFKRLHHMLQTDTTLRSIEVVIMSIIRLQGIN